MIPHNESDKDNFIAFGVINTFRYTNYRGETEMRRVIPLCMRYGRTEHHKEDQWLIECYCTQRNALRTFALNDIHPR